MTEKLDPAVVKTPTYPVEGYEPDNNLFYATFGFGHIHAGGYVRIVADSADQAYEWMSVRYNNRWASLYGEKAGKNQILEWGYKAVCNADIRSGHDGEVESICELLVPFRTLGEIQPILDSPECVKLYYHHGYTAGQKLADVMLLVTWINQGPRKISMVEIDTTEWAGYARLVWAYVPPGHVG